jgi:phosphoribosylamine--glycine ligase
MNILLVGNRSIQHLLAARLEQEGCLVYVYPGQAFGGYRCVTSEQLEGMNFDLIVMGSARYFDDPAIAALRDRGVPYFGPDHAAGRLETSKEEFKRFAAKYDIPTPTSHTFTSFEQAAQYISTAKPPYVIKADGPARGCGVAICHDRASALEDLHRKLEDESSLYYAGRVVIEEFIDGFEVAINVFIDGSDYTVFPATKPHKRRNNSDSGPIVAGMGSIAPVKLNENFSREFEDTILKPTLAGMAKEGWRFRGCLFINLIMTDSRVSVLEFNCRMGDPAMLVNILLLESNLTDLLKATAEGQLATVTPVLRKQAAAAAVTLIDPAYPEHETQASEFDFDTGNLFNPDTNAGIVIAGAHLDPTSGKMVVNSGVVATAVALGDDYDAAMQAAEQLADSLPQFHHRTEIGATRTAPANYRR